MKINSQVLKQRVQSINAFLKKYHVIKWAVFIMLCISFVFSSYLLFLARTTDVKALKAGLEQTTKVYDLHDQEAGELFSQKGTYVPLEQISENIVNAVISTEDKRFYDHQGIDYMGIARSLVGFVTHGFKLTGGGSTLTQQLAKNSYLTQQQTFLRKAQEIFLALEIERHYTKDEILTMYLNHAYFGHGVWGVEDASKKYFGKSAKDISVSEAAVIAGMLKGPGYYNPIDHEDQAKNRRNTVLQLMADNDKISKDILDTVSQEPIVLKDAYETATSYKYPYFFDAVIREAKEKYGLDEEDILTKGYKIYTTLDQTYQDQLDNAYARGELFPNADDGTLVQSASILADPTTGGVMALIGGRGNYVYQGFSRATQMYRQPGSTLKPLVVYTPALENGYTPESMMIDEELSYGTDNYTPKNWDHQTVGTLPMYQALALSKNTSAVWLLDKIGLKKGIDKLYQFGIETEKADHYLGIALGGMTKGVTPLALTSAYTAFANKGVRQDAYFIRRIVDATGAVIVNKTHTDSQRVMSEKIATDMTRMMLGVYTSEGTGQVRLPAGLQIAGKTGTTEFADKGVQDQWAVAYTPDFVFTSWMGFDKTDDTHHLSIDYQNSIHPFFNVAVNNIIAVSPKTSFETTSIQSEKQAEQEQKKQDWLSGVKDLGETLKKGAENLWNGVIDFFNGKK
ncbi:PBP1A family penicillin-binding protein [Granulicatella sp. zg-ZJ]|uniref:PBP1A family penicillin-binding protein n=1 Tax=Granulicatella sp. zg-ZJ TaxID=2678504 RepID=UPI0013D29B92|nr:PBP1A family penicillin-binding protein [Granulicatella sp. zg-ZJ]NEW62895.1 PBP1A family penicillin-binding protein [Granulicatella sp. zg-ZJ]